MSDVTQEKNAHRGGRSRSLLLIVLITILLLTAVAVASVLLGWVKVSIKTPSQSVIVRTEVCGQDVINRYNSLYSATSNTEDEYAKNEAALEAFSQEVAQKVGAENDPTCQYIIFAGALTKDDSNKAKQALETIVQLADEGHYVNTKLNGIIDIDQMKLRVEILEVDSPTGSG